MADRFVTVDSETYALPAPVVDALVGALPPGGGVIQIFDDIEAVMTALGNGEIQVGDIVGIVAT